MAIGKWIGGFLGFMSGGVLGALAGFTLGALFDKSLDAVNEPTDSREGFGNTYGSANAYGRTRQQADDYRQRVYEGQRNSFLFSMLVLSSYVIKADGKVMHSEMEFVRQFLRANFGESAVRQGEQILLKLFEKQKQLGNYEYRTIVDDAARQIAQNMDYAQRLQLVNYLVLIARADGHLSTEEAAAIREIGRCMGVSAVDVESMLHLAGSSHGNTGDTTATDSLDDAYKVLGISRDATDAEVKAAYRQMALKHHPDKVAALGEDIRKAAERKFQEINAAKERIYQARGMR